MITISVVIPTYHRPDDLGRCLDSLLRQTLLPHEVLVVDDGSLERVPLCNELTARGVDVRHVRKDRPGLTESRNMGIRMASGDVTLFLDDDVTLAHDFLQRLIAVYEDDPERRIGGAAGIIVNRKPASMARRLRYLFDRLFLLSGPLEGRVLRSGAFVSFGTTPHPIRTRREVDFLPGCGQSYRREVFQTLQFTEGYRDHAFGEDKDFSYQVAKRWKLLVTPEAQFAHHEASPMRPNHRESGRKRVVGRYLFFHRHLRAGRLSTLLFWYSMAGYFLARSIIALLSRRPEEYARLWGMFDGLSDIIARRLPLAYAARPTAPQGDFHESLGGPSSDG